MIIPKTSAQTEAMQKSNFWRDAGVFVRCVRTFSTKNRCFLGLFWHMSIFLVLGSGYLSVDCNPATDSVSCGVAGFLSEFQLLNN